MLAALRAAVLFGVEGLPVVVEVHVGPGMPTFTIVGQPEGACAEARDRVRAAVLSSGLAWPQTRITVNLAPARLRKGGALLDLPIALGVLVASRVLPPDRVQGVAFLGELGLDGTVRPGPGIVALVDAMEGADVTEVVVPSAVAHEAAIVGRLRVRCADRLDTLVDALCGVQPWPDPPERPDPATPVEGVDLADVRGHAVARQALEVAAAGGHHLVFSGPPGAGKTMLARRLAGLLPPLSGESLVEVARVHSAAGLPVRIQAPVPVPFRAPHHSSSLVSLVGGGTASMRPGELSCAHRGVLFLDELGEFSAATLDALRQPLEEGVVHISRARGTVCLPAEVLLIAATNPCPCGWRQVDADPLAPPGPECRCSESAISRYQRRLSGPLLDRFDLRLTLRAADPEELLQLRSGEPTAVVAERVRLARNVASQRGVTLNRDLRGRSLERWVQLAPSGVKLVHQRLASGSLTARGLDRVKRVSRTLADLAGLDVEALVPAELVAAALELRGNLGRSVTA